MKVINWCHQVLKDKKKSLEQLQITMQQKMCLANTTGLQMLTRVNVGLESYSSVGKERKTIIFFGGGQRCLACPVDLYCSKSGFVRKQYTIVNRQIHWIIICSLLNILKYHLGVYPIFRCTPNASCHGSRGAGICFSSSRKLQRVRNGERSDLFLGLSENRGYPNNCCSIMGNI